GVEAANPELRQGREDDATGAIRTIAPAAQISATVDENGSAAGELDDRRVPLADGEEGDTELASMRLERARRKRDQCTSPERDRAASKPYGSPRQGRNPRWIPGDEK